MEWWQWVRRHPILSRVQPKKRHYLQPTSSVIIVGLNTTIWICFKLTWVPTWRVCFQNLGVQSASRISQTMNLLRNTLFLILAIPLLSTSVKAAVRPSPVSKTCMDIYLRCIPLCFTAVLSARRCSVPRCLFRFTWPPSTVTREPRSTVRPANGTSSKSMTCTCMSNRSISTNNARCTVASSAQSPLPRTLSCSVTSQHIATNAVPAYVPRPDFPSRCPYTRNSVPRARVLKVTTWPLHLSPNQLPRTALECCQWIVK